MTLSAEDKLAVHELIALHGHLMDAGELDRMDELFAVDVVYDVTAFGAGELHGCEAIKQAALALGDRNPVGHHVTNVYVIEDADGTVRAVSKGIGINSNGSVGSVVYEDIVRREAAGWRIAYRKVKPRRAPLRP
ncbi:nuclear transport factor 2 family protein [Micromonospora tulbaghiae]|uniref:SnoaL-like domain-containing protein n=1 Tax=Micromonospora tulbaghiae TaxID=479978 RepID=A0ABY0KQK8_9ACTN|nr:nuclear transport factor 2 family protein [Micromonospora tulbaghiae]MDX5457403.1 nuclear transport factor 2 family protein [Micromonospora tulbaghiae]SCE95709.1 SnoaL-like domain-containing protein [Micromonospora tulbaghiae]